jgi:hypothetical protein
MIEDVARRRKDEYYVYVVSMTVWANPLAGHLLCVL